MALALEREQTVCRSLLTLTGTVVAGPEPITACLARGCIALAFTARVHAVARSHDRLAEVMPSREARSATRHQRWNSSKSCTGRSWHLQVSSGPALSRCYLAWYAAALP